MHWASLGWYTTHRKNTVPRFPSFLCPVVLVNVRGGPLPHKLVVLCSEVPYRKPFFVFGSFVVCAIERLIWDEFGSAFIQFCNWTKTVRMFFQY